MSQPRRVVITGMGVMSPIGADVPSFWQNVTNGVSGVGPITLFDASQFGCQIAAEVKNFEPGKWFNAHKDSRHTDRFTQLAVAAAKLAMADAGLTTPVGD